MVLSTQEKSPWTVTLKHSYPQIELSSEIPKNSQETILDVATFANLLLVMDNLFEHLPNFQDFWILQMKPL